MHAQPAGHLTVRRPDQGYQDQDNICLTILDPSTKILSDFTCYYI